jgi:TM2 domain-containing membrane protein YozV/DNA-directed RNA polymerase subunit RPC12/RpoP
MIEVKCGTCGKNFGVKDEFAGKTGKCLNCGSPVMVPAAGAAWAAAQPQPSVTQPQASVTQPAAGPTIVVQMQAPPQGSTGPIGPAEKSLLLTFLFSLLCSGLQYFYLGQTGKGVVFTLVTLFVCWPIVLMTCGIGLVVFIPYNLILLIDSLVVANRMKSRAVGLWRFF